MSQVRGLFILVGAAVAVAAGALSAPAQTPPEPPWFDRYVNQAPPPSQPAQPQATYVSSPGTFAAPPPVFGRGGINPVQARPYGALAAPAANGPAGPLPNAGVFPAPPPPSFPGGLMPNEPRRFPPTDMPEPPSASIFMPSQIIAWVGDQPIQVGDIMPLVEQTMAPYLAKMPPEAIEKNQDAIEQQRQKLMRQALKGAIEAKLLYLDFLRTLPSDKRDEVLSKIKAKAEEQFQEKQLPQAMAKAKVSSTGAMEDELRKFGSSLAQQRIMFVERALGQSVVGQKINFEPEIRHQEMLDYYRQHAKDFERVAQARWEKLTVKFDRFRNKDEAWSALANLGNEVLRGAPFDAVAKRSSQAADATDGGYHDWTSQGSLASEPLDQALFSLPVGKLSERLEDKEGYHIVRVIERRDGGMVPFTDAQVDIKERLKEEKKQKQVEAYVARLRSEIRVWTIFDNEPPAEVGNAKSAPSRR